MPCYQDTGLGCPVALLAGFPSKQARPPRPQITPEQTWENVRFSSVFGVECPVVECPVVGGGQTRVTSVEGGSSPPG